MAATSGHSQQPGNHSQAFEQKVPQQQPLFSLQDPAHHRQDEHRGGGQQPVQQDHGTASRGPLFTQQ
jgi:hypothetical protein